MLPLPKIASRLLTILPLAAGQVGAAPTKASLPSKPPTTAKVPAAGKPAPAIPALVSISVEPAVVDLDGPRDERTLIVTGRFDDGQDRDVTPIVRFTPNNPSVGKVFPGGIARGWRDGRTTIHVTLGKLAARFLLSVRNRSREVPVSFEDEVQPILTKAGCNQGACHGSQHGKGGFKLSLLGYDGASDYRAIVRQNEGRRVVVTDAGASLLLKKAVLDLPHAGGRRFDRDSYEYRTLLAWVQEGAPESQGEAPVVESLSVVPPVRITPLPNRPADLSIVVRIPQARGPDRRVRLGPVYRVVALARYSGGRVADVTRRAQFNSLNDGTVEVSPSGEVVLKGRGETHVMVRYRGQANVSRATMPYRRLTRLPELPRANFIDEAVQSKWKEIGLLPSPRADDAEFHRRVYFDLIGTLPSPEEVREFLASADPDKRKKLVDRLLDRPEYVDTWTLRWGDLLRNNRDKLGEKGMWSFYNWLRTAFRENKPFDRFAHELITAQGSTFTTGPANYYRVVSAPGDLAETTSQVFLGIRLACAKCHQHPFEKWSQDDYWRLAAYFSRVGLKSSQEFGLFGGEQIVRLNSSGEVRNPRSGEVMKPAPLDAEPVDDPVDRRRALSRWLTSPDNPFFARNVVNRYWGYLMGRGIVDPLDDVRVTNPPSNPELLDALARDFVAHKLDVKHLLRTIATSEVYQLSSQPTRENARDQVFFTRYTVKRMGAEELLDAINTATLVPDKFPNLPAGMRAIQLPDPGVQNYFLETFGRAERAIVCECERSAEPNLAQALHLMNSDFIQSKVSIGKGRLAALEAAKKTDAEIAEELYLATVSRFPTQEEIPRALAIVAQAPNRKEGLEDLLWTLLNTREFVLKH